MTLATSIRRTHLTADLVRQLPGQAGFAFKPWATVQRSQERRLARTVAHAYDTVPYYRETMRRLGLRPHDLRTATDLARLPIVEREEVQRDPEYFVSRAQPLERYLRVRSGGSSGAPRQIFYDASSVVANGAFVERHRAVVRKLARTRVRYREAIIESPFGTTQIVHEFLARHVVVPPSLAIRRLDSRWSSRQRNIAALSAFRPDVIDGYGSYLEVFLPASTPAEDRLRGRG